ncbi:hypothetical protein QGM71_13960 [Virgibacillus sp. C22-A2]|uniref:Uncharacterized protein n=1 Tax=Virgibacillus tibetensis TaxID=3042313 RepID=A0ABU6KHP3_9BACI|nr:hypothetical protein [Virgibacillus sp. C22-A2]
MAFILKTFNYKKIISVLILSIIIIFSFFIAFHYVSYGKILDNNRESIEVTEKKDFESLKSKDINLLEQLGFSEREIKTIQEIDLESLTLSDWIFQLEMYDNNSINPDDLVLSEINSHSEDNEGDIVNINVNPVETIYKDEENGGGKTFYTKLHYTVDIEKPMLLQSQDQFNLKYNNWYPFFGYAKLRYISTKGEVYEEFVSNEETSYGNEPLEFEVRKKRNGDMFYLSGISGMYILKSQVDLSLYAEYTHHQLIKSNVLGKHWSDWIWISN